MSIFKKNLGNYILTALFIASCVALLLVKSKTSSLLIFFSPQFPVHTIVGVWEWRSIHAPETFVGLERFKEDGFNRIYLDISNYLEDSNDETVRQLEQYLISAHSAGIQVHALVGSPLWTRSSHQYLLIRTLEFIRNMQRNAISRNTVFDGVQFDLEPYNLPEFSEDPAEIMNEYLDQVDRIIVQAKNDQTRGLLNADFQVGFAIPYWFDGNRENLREIKWKGEEKTVFKHLVKIINNFPKPYFAVMAYRPAIKGENGVIALAKIEMQFINQYASRIEVIIGQEIKNNSLFKKKSDIVNAVKQITAGFENFSVYTGVAFNDAKEYSLIQ